MPRKYASGRKAWFICGRCGLRGFYRESVFDGQLPSLRVHQACWEPKHPQENLKRITDPIALWRPTSDEVPALTPPILSGFVASNDGFLSWTAAVSKASQIESYEVYRALRDETDYTLVGTRTITRTAFGDITNDAASRVLTDLVADYTLDYFRYYVVAIAADGTTAISNTVVLATRPLAVVLSGSFNAPNIDLTWTASADTTLPLDHYTLFRSVDGGAYTAIATTLAAAPRTYTDTNVNRFAHSYNYYVVAYLQLDVGSANSNIVPFPLIASVILASKNINVVNTLIKSFDGINWATCTTPSAAIFGIAHSPTLGLIVCCGAANAMLTSPDSINWTLRAGAQSLINWEDITWSPTLNLFVKVGNNGTQGVATSPDGINWTLRTTPNKQWKSVRWSPQLNMFAAGSLTPSDNQAVITSPDGINWTPRTASGFFLAFGFNGYKMTVDPVTGHFYCSSNGDTGVLKSTDGTTWTFTSTGLGFGCTGVASNGAGVVVMPTNGGGHVFARSTNSGASWGPTVNGDYCTDVVYSTALARWVGVCDTNAPDGQRAIYSSDGNTWVNGVTPLALNTMFRVISALIAV